MPWPPPPGHDPGALDRARRRRLLTAIGAVRRTARRAVQQAWDQEPLPPARSELLLAGRPAAGDHRGRGRARAAPGPEHGQHAGRQLAAEGLLDRGTDTADRRAVRLTVTAGARRGWRLPGPAGRTGRPGAGWLTADDQQALAAAVPALRRLAGQLEAR